MSYNQHLQFTIYSYFVHNPLQVTASIVLDRSVHLPVLHNPQEETVIIGGAYAYNHRPNRSRSYNRPSYNETVDLEEESRRLDGRSWEETVIIEEVYDYWPNRSHSFYQPTYEENLELEEQMGRVGSRLSEETIMGHLKIRSCDATSKRIDEEPDICVICQGEYEKDELIGGLQCRHEYHVNCVTTWLQQHNSCPVCKAVAVSSDGYKF